MCSWPCLPIARSCWQTDSVWVHPDASLPGCTGMSGEGVGGAGSSFHGSVLSSGLSCNVYRPPRLQSFSQPCWHLPTEDFPARWATGWRDGPVPTSVEYFGRCWWAVECCNPLHCFSVPDPQCVPVTQAQLLSLTLWFAQWVLHPNPSLLLHPGATVSTQLCMALGSVLRFHLIYPVRSDTPTFRCRNVCIFQACVCVCWAGNPMVNYSCPTRNFEGRDLDVLSCCRAADVCAFILDIGSLSSLYLLISLFFYSLIPVLST